MASYTPTSSLYSSADGSIGVGVETSFTVPDVADQTWPLNPPVPAIELEGTVTMRSTGLSACLIRIWLDSRLILNENMTTEGPGATNLQVHISPEALQTPATSMRVYIGGTGAGGVNVDCEVELAGRWQ